MPNPEIANHRLHNQYLSRPTLQSAGEVVGWLGAVQSQDYAGGVWGVAQRTSGLKELDINRAFDAGEILRTHVMRPTWHFVAPADVRWMLMLTAPRVHQLNAYYYRQLGLDETILTKACDILVKSLEGGKQLIRTEIITALNQSGVDTAGALRLGYIMMYAELEGLVCSGAKRGKQQTYALLEERVAPASALTRDAALAEISKRYFTSHGPATVHDFAWWSGLTVSDAKTGIEMVKSSLESNAAEDKTYWYSPSTAPVIRDESPKVYLLPNYDEYTVSYKDRSDIGTEEDAARFDSVDNPVFAHIIILDSQVVGTWRRTLKKREVLVNIKPFMSLTDAQHQAVSDAVRQYGEFLGLTPILSFS